MFRRLLDGVDPGFARLPKPPWPPGPGSARCAARGCWIGHRLHTDAEIDIDPSLSLAEAHCTAHDAEHGLIHTVPKLTTAIIHAYPAGDTNPAEQHSQGSESQTTPHRHN